MSDCHVSTGELVDYLHGELPVERDALVAMHLAQCAACAGARDTEAALTDRVRSVARAQERAMPPGTKASILAAARGSQTAFRSSWYVRSAIALPLAAAAAIAIWIGVRPFAANPPKATIAAAYFVNHHAMFSPIAPFADDAPIPAAFASDDAPH